MNINEFGIISLSCAVLIPLIILIIGLLFRKRSLPKINFFLGYRTSLSTRNEDTWEVANRTLGKVWLTLGLITLPLSAISIIPFINKTEEAAGTALTILTLIQVVILILSIIPVELKLRKTFDENGKRK